MLLSLLSLSYFAKYNGCFQSLYAIIRFVLIQHFENHVLLSFDFPIWFAFANYDIIKVRTTIHADKTNSTLNQSQSLLRRQQARKKAAQVSCSSKICYESNLSSQCLLLLSC